MSYQKAYLRLFNRIGEVIELAEKANAGEKVNIPLLLKQIQNVWRIIPPTSKQTTSKSNFDVVCFLSVFVFVGDC